MEKSKLISVIILSYKNINGIYETLDSVLKQTYNEIEIVVSDDGTPEFPELEENIKNYITERKRDNVKNIIIHSLKVNSGTVKNINSAIKCASGEYIKILSAEDCLKDKDALEKYYNFLAHSAYLICFAKMRGVTPEGSYKYELEACESDYDLLKSYSVEQTKNRLYARNFLPAPAWFARKKLFLEYGFFPEEIRLIEDYPYWCYLVSRGVEFGYLDEVLIDYKLSGVSSAGSYSEMFMDDMMKIYDIYIFPYDKRYGRLQYVYNLLKKEGLNYYMAKARWHRLSKKQKFFVYLKYGIFYLYTGMQRLNNNWKNKKMMKDIREEHMDIKIFNFEKHGDCRGTLIALEELKNIPFKIKRVYYMYQTGGEVRRGFHAHKCLKQILICVKGHCKVLLDNGKEKEVILLDRPDKGLYIGANIWREMFDFTEDAVLMVLASELYDETDYIRDYQLFMNYIND